MSPEEVSAQNIVQGRENSICKGPVAVQLESASGIDDWEGWGLTRN